jgi:hypothetical protein
VCGRDPCCRCARTCPERGRDPPRSNARGRTAVADDDGPRNVGIAVAWPAAVLAVSIPLRSDFGGGSGTLRQESPEGRRAPVGLRATSSLR